MSVNWYDINLGGHDTQQMRFCDLLQPQVGGSEATYKDVLGRGRLLPSKARHCIGH